jgi:redox-sensitive bicupin YhaK (pirin superfamily)
MIYVRRADQRRHIKSDAQDTYLTFDPDNESDPFRRGFRSLEALNEEILNPAMKLNRHQEGPIEYLTYVRKGAFLDWSSSGKQAQFHVEEFHRASSSRRLRHQFVNESVMEGAHVFQSWITPDARVAMRGAERHRFPSGDRRGVLRLVASSDGMRGSLRVAQDIRMYSSLLLVGHHLVHEIGEGRGAWLHVVEGRVALQEQSLATRDAAGYEGELTVNMTAQEPSEILLFNLA